MWKTKFQNQEQKGMNLLSKSAKMKQKSRLLVAWDPQLKIDSLYRWLPFLETIKSNKMTTTTIKTTLTFYQNQILT